MVFRPYLRAVYVPPDRYSQFEPKRQAAAQACERFGGLNFKVDLASVERRRALIRELSHGPCENTAGRETQFLVLRYKSPAHRSVGIEDEHGRIGQTIHRNLARGIDIELGQLAIAAVSNAVRPNYKRFVIGQQGECDALSHGKIMQCRDAIVADSRHAEACLLEQRKIALQLAELPFAVHSPVGRAEEDQNQAAPLHQRVQAVFTSG